MTCHTREIDDYAEQERNFDEQIKAAADNGLLRRQLEAARAAITAKREKLIQDDAIFHAWEKNYIESRGQVWVHKHDADEDDDTHDQPPLLLPR